MKDISTAEAYFLCAVQNKGKIFGHEDKKIACLLSAVFYEMKMAGLIIPGKDQIQIIKTKELTPDCAPYFAPVYSHLKELDSLELKHIVQDYNSGWSDRHLNALTTAIGTGLSDRGLATKAKLGLFNGRVYFMPYKAAVPSLAAELLVSLLYQTPIPDEDGFLWLLLEKSACIPDAFTSQQKEDINARISSALHSSQHPDLADLSLYTDRLLTLVKHYPI